jgi:hypothetical protein
MSIAGTWNLVIKTPIGQQQVVLELTDENGTLSGVARGPHETVPLVDLARKGDRLTWAQSITKPLRLNLVFDVSVTGNSLTGSSKAGRLPRSRVTGTRESR